MRRFRHAVTAALVAAIGMGSAQDGVGGPSAIQPALDEWGIRTIMTLSERPQQLVGAYPTLVYVMTQSEEYLIELGLDSEETRLGESPVPKPCLYSDGSGGVPQFGGGGSEDFDRPTGAPPAYDPVTPATLSGPAGQGELVIVDDFDLAALADGTDVSPSTATGASLLLDPDGSNDPLETFHGNLVVLHVLRLLGSTSAVLTQQPASAWVGGRPTWTVVAHTDDSDLTLVLVDVDYADITTAVAALSGLPSNTTINLSWNIFECSLIDDYQRASETLRSSPTLVDFIFTVLGASIDRDVEAFHAECAGLLADFGVTEAELTPEECQTVLTVRAALEMEDFAKQLKVQSLGMFENIVSGSDPARVYASAGNQGLSFALAPASWQGVNAVGACIQTAPPSKRAAFSNAALQLLGDYTVREGYYAPGGWFEHPAFGPTKGYWGSSFSAPHVAVLDALGSLSERSPGCFTVY